MSTRPGGTQISTHRLQQALQTGDAQSQMLIDNALHEIKRTTPILLTSLRITHAPR